MASAALTDHLTTTVVVALAVAGVGAVLMGLGARWIRRMLDRAAQRARARLWGLITQVLIGLRQPLAGLVGGGVLAAALGHTLAVSMAGLALLGGPALARAVWAEAGRATRRRSPASAVARWAGIAALVVAGRSWGLGVLATELGSVAVLSGLGDARAAREARLPGLLFAAPGARTAGALIDQADQYSGIDNRLAARLLTHADLHLRWAQDHARTETDWTRLSGQRARLLDGHARISATPTRGARLPLSGLARAGRERLARAPDTMLAVIQLTATAGEASGLGGSWRERLTPALTRARARTRDSYRQRMP